MKQIKKITAFFSVAILLLMVGCIKDRGVTAPTSQKSPTPITVDFINQTQTAALELVTSYDYYFYGEMNSSLNSYPAGTTITITKNMALVTAAGQDILPDSLYTVASPQTVTVDPVTHLARFKITIFPIKYDLVAPHNYAIGFTITAVNNGVVIATNKNNYVLSVSAKNKYDGIYTITGAALRAGDPVLSGNFGPYERSLATVGPNTVAWLGSIPWANGSGSALPGGYEPNITVDPATNLITGINLNNCAGPNGCTGIGAMTNPVVRTDIVGTTQHWDPATKTLYFEFSYNPGLRLFSFKAVYNRPR